MKLALGAELGLLGRLTRGYRLRPWRSPYLRWRIETYAGRPAESIGFGGFWSFVWRQRRELWSYLRWAAQMRAATVEPAGRPTAGLGAPLRRAPQVHDSE